MRKLVSVLLTLAVVLGLSLTMAVPVAVSAGGGTSETFNVTADRDDANLYNDVNAKVTKTDDLEAGVVEFMVEILDEPPWGGHCQDAATVYISTDIDTVDFQVMYFNFLNTKILSVTKFGWYYRAFPWISIFDGVPFVPLAESGTGITATGELGEHPGGAPADELYYTSFTIDIPIDLLGGPGATYYYAISFSTNMQGAYPQAMRYSVELDASNFATASVPANTAVGLTVDVPDIVAINVDPTSIDFGTLKPGQTSGVEQVTVTNIGTHTVDVDVSLQAWSSDLFKSNLMLKNDPKNWTDWSTGTPWSKIVEGLVMDASDVVKTKLPVPSDYTPSDTEAGTLIFEATGV